MTPRAIANEESTMTTDVEAVTIGTGERRAAPVPGGPTVEILRAAAPDRQLAVLHITVPPGGGMPEHTHGPSEVLLIPQDGTIRLTPAGEPAIELRPGILATVPVGRPVALENPTDHDVRILVVVAPPEFAAAAASWPAADAPA